VPAVATWNDAYTALALTVRDRVLKQGVQTLERYARDDARAVAYLSAEFLPGPHLATNLLNLGITEQVRQAMSELGVNLDEVWSRKRSPAWGTAGWAGWRHVSRIRWRRWGARHRLRNPLRVRHLRPDHRGRLAVEVTDKWLRFGNPWEIPRPEIAYDVPFGRPHRGPDRRAGGTASAGFPTRWSRAWRTTPRSWDTAPPPATGCGSGRPKRWSRLTSRPSTRGLLPGGRGQDVLGEHHQGPVPNDEVAQGKTLRLQQQFFFVTCSLQDMIRVHRLLGRSLDRFHEKWAIQLNDTHPAIAVRS